MARTHTAAVVHSIPRRRAPTGAMRQLESSTAAREARARPPVSVNGNDRDQSHVRRHKGGTRVGSLGRKMASHCSQGQHSTSTHRHGDHNAAGKCVNTRSHHRVGARQDCCACRRVTIDASLRITAKPPFYSSFRRAGPRWTILEPSISVVHLRRCGAYVRRSARFRRAPMNSGLLSRCMKCGEPQGWVCN